MPRIHIFPESSITMLPLAYRVDYPLRFSNTLILSPHQDIQFPIFMVLKNFPLNFHFD